VVTLIDVVSLIENRGTHVALVSEIERRGVAAPPRR
jgi:hypothetical protein